MYFEINTVVLHVNILVKMILWTQRKLLLTEPEFDVGGVSSGRDHAACHEVVTLMHRPHIV